MKVQIESLSGQPISSDIFALDSDAIDILNFCQQMSAECWMGYVDDKLICCWGLIPPTLLSTQAYLWMHSTPAVRDHSFLLVRHSQRVIEAALDRYSTIVGHCKAKADDSMRWLKWLGAEFSPADSGYCQFVIRRKFNG